MKKYSVVEVKLLIFIISAINVVENSVYGHGGSASGELTRGWLDLIASMDVVGN
jgi:hypothetical protein